MATVQQILDRIDAKLYDLIDNPDSLADYRIGDKAVQRSKIITSLMAMRTKYEDIAALEPYENIKHIAMDFGDFGQDEQELIGDDTS